MKPQAEIIKEIDKTSSQDSLNKPSSVARLVILPPVILFNELIIKGALFRGVPGWKKAVNTSLLCFVTEAKKYEHDYKDTSEMERDSKDFL
ncbi:hypothetical protein MNBD_NITROSPINAE02-1212 [hydrothermal vent metagenome]|uniref:Uncharacterized protein n=1 Tax=hydrothermal vent metagenome TaxID=652676 RepID=A0A3B1CS80_9ZZZZ